MVLFKKFIYLTIVVVCVSSWGQTRDSLALNTEYMPVRIGDTITIDLDEVKLLPKRKFKVKGDRNYYNWLRKKVFKAYPYAVLASERLDTLNIRLSKIKSHRKKKKYIKIAQRYLEGTFTDQLKKLTRTEGRILIKLIHRQTGKTTFNQIKSLRSGWRAFWYNSTANLFKLSLKTEYRPEVDNEDFLIEDILLRSFLNDRLVDQGSKLNIDQDQMYKFHAGPMDFSVYKSYFSKLNKRHSRKNSGS